MFVKLVTFLVRLTIGIDAMSLSTKYKDDADSEYNENLAS